MLGFMCLTIFLCGGAIGFGIGLFLHKKTKCSGYLHCIENDSAGDAEIYLEISEPIDDFTNRSYADFKVVKH